jgi:hypothetical protein
MSLAVSRAEANLLTVARVAVGVVPAIDAMRLLAVSVTPPQKLGPTARAALADTLSRGTVLSLTRQGGWLPEGEKRLWERHEAVPLHFSGNAVRLLAWMLETPLSGQDAKPLVLEGDLTPAEDFLVALALDRLRGTGCDVLLARQLGVRRAPLSTLTHAAFLAHELPLDEVPALELARHGVFLEGMRVLLARAWLAAERWKRELTAPAELARVGRAQEATLASFFAVLDAGARRELAGFLIDVGLQWLTPDQTALELTRSLTQDAPLRERTEARRRAAATLRALGRLRAWHDEARNVRFIDDGYDAAQRLVADWDRLGEPGFARAAALVAELDAIPTLQPAAS